MARRPPDLIYAVDERPPWGTLLGLGLQHALLACVYLVLIVIVARSAQTDDATLLSMLSLALLALAGAFVLQASRLGSGLLAVPVYSAIYLGPSVLAAQTGGLPLVFGMTVFAGLVEVALAFGLRRLRWLFPPAVSGLIVLIVGIDLGLVGIGRVLDVRDFTAHHAVDPLRVGAAALTLAVAVGVTIWGRGVVRLLASLLGLLAGAALAGGAGLVEPSRLELVGRAAWVGLPGLSHLGLAFEPSLVPAYLAAAVAAALRSIGVVTTAEKINDADWKRPSLPRLQRGTAADGLGCALAGLLGATGLNASPSLVGVSSAARTTSRAIAFAAAAALLLGALVPKFGALFMALPLSVAGAMLVFTSSLMIAGGIGIIVSRERDSRATFVIGISLLLALSHQVFPQYFAALPPALRTFTGGALSLGVFSAILLTLLFRLGIRRSAAAAGGDADSIDAFLSGIAERCRAWKVPGDVADVCGSSAAEAVEHLRTAGGVEAFELCRLSYDDLDLTLELHYRGPPLRLPDAGPDPRRLDEEQPFAHGITLFLTGIYPDRVETRHSGEGQMLRMVFST